MASSPVTGERPSGFRRSSSQFAALPQRTLSFHEQAGLAKGDADADVLYTHPSVKIYLFKPPTDALQSLDKTQKTLPDADYPIDAIEVLPWRSRTEALSAKGKLIIEKVQGSVHFLKAGSLIHTIMRNSQCWCVDGESKFVMRVGRLRYQRIEFPTAEPEEVEKVAEFKEVIAKILKFEKTPCPFIRGFQVDLPEDAITPRRRGTWKRKESLTSTIPEDDSPVVRRGKAARALSMRGTPPNSFPSRSMTYRESERPRTASTPSSAPRFSFPDVRTESPTNYTSGEENTDSDRHDSESDRPESSQHSEVEDSDRETRAVPIIRSPLKNVQTASTAMAPPEVPADRPQMTAGRRSSTVESQIKLFEQYKDRPVTPIVRRESQVRSRSIEAQQSDPLPRNEMENLDETIDVSDTDSFGRDYSHSTRADSDDTLWNTLLREVRASNYGVGGASHESEEDSSSFDREPVDLMNGTAMKPVSEKLPSGIDERHTDEVALKVDQMSELSLLTRGATQEEIQDVEFQAAKLVSQDQEPTSSTAYEEPELELEAVRKQAKDECAVLRTAHIDDDAESIVSTDSFHTTISDENLDQQQTLQSQSLNTRPFSHRREISEMTITAGSFENDAQSAELEVDARPEDIVPTQVNTTDDFELNAPGAFIETSELRQRLRHRRSLSPLPHASILRPPSSTGQGSAIPAVLLQRAATLAVVKPIEVVVFVARILARIAQGATMNDLTSGDLFRRPGGPRRTASGTFEQIMPSRRRTSKRENTDDEGEDDYGLPVLGRRRNSSKEAQNQISPDAESSSQSSLD